MTQQVLEPQPSVAPEDGGPVNSLPAPSSIDERDYLSEAFRIIAGDTMLLAQREHLTALQDHYWRFIEQLHQRALDIIGGKA